ncbi:hypothetical protein JQX08_09090 [Pseudomonas sp. UL073]|uniref:Uncharacterized protein n=1 Tax=Zestomonas insulae TaxID=2809017 RepID=A0ABS2ICL8_9GAMM|nr:hypothetical protein [Pseudomonas insulae]MBM7060861.1 hypothetical protein [Pseudomonas insulae]
MRLLFATLLLIATTTSHAAALNPPQPAPAAQAELVVTRPRELPLNACDVGLFVQNQLAARLHPGDSISIAVPSGELALGVAQVGSAYCAASRQHIRGQSTLVEPGARLHYLIDVDSDGVFLAPTQ